VPFILVQETPTGQPKPTLRTDGSLRDIAPTILGLLDLKEPVEMTGRDMRK
jgi:bisphosphoglycerate-independent phosphoglycerate mutase (AlkP superfamily)